MEIAIDSSLLQIENLCQPRFLLSIDWVLQLLTRFRCPGFCATRETAGIVKCPSVDVWQSVCLCMKFNNFKNLLDLCSGVSCVQVWWETLRIAALAAKLYLSVSCRAPLTFRLWSCSRSYNFVIKSGNFWTTQLVLRLITLLYDSLQLLYQSRGSQGCRRRGLNTYCSRLGRSMCPSVRLLTRQKWPGPPSLKCLTNRRACWQSQ